MTLEEVRARLKVAMDIIAETEFGECMEFRVEVQSLHNDLAGIVRKLERAQAAKQEGGAA